MLIKFFKPAAFLPTMAETPSSSSSSSPALHPPTARSAKPVSEALLNEKVPYTPTTTPIPVFLYLSIMKTLLFPPFPPNPPHPNLAGTKGNTIANIPTPHKYSGTTHFLTFWSAPPSVSRLALSFQFYYLSEDHGPPGWDSALALEGRMKKLMVWSSSPPLIRLTFLLVWKCKKNVLAKFLYHLIQNRLREDQSLERRLGGYERFLLSRLLKNTTPLPPMSVVGWPRAVVGWIYTKGFMGGREVVHNKDVCYQVFSLSLYFKK